MSVHMNEIPLVASALTSTSKPPTKAARLIANTPALRAAQKQLLSKAILSLELVDAEAAQTKLVQKKKTEVQLFATMITALEHAIHPEKPRRFTLMTQFRAIHMIIRHCGLHHMYTRCESAWKELNDYLYNIDGRFEKAERAGKAYEEGKSALRVIRQRRKNAVRCVQVLKSYLTEVRERQQMEA